MKLHFQITIAFMVLVLTTLVPAYAYAAKASGGARTHSQTYHNRTPTARTHGSHTHRG